MNERNKDAAELAALILVFTIVSAIFFYAFGFYAGDKYGQLSAIKECLKND